MHDTLPLARLPQQCSCVSHHPSHQTPLGSVLAVVWAPGWRSACGLFGAASHLSDGPCFLTRCDAITALPQTPRSPAGSALVSRRRAHRNGAAAQLAQMPRPCQGNPLTTAATDIHTLVTLKSGLPLTITPVCRQRLDRNGHVACVSRSPQRRTCELRTPQTRRISPFSVISQSFLTHNKPLLEPERRRSQLLGAGLPTPG